MVDKKKEIMYNIFVIKNRKEVTTMNIIEERYYELLEARDRAYDQMCGSYREDYKREFERANTHFANYCIAVLGMIMEQQSDILIKLKY